jgi:hypothetical protein
MPSNFEQVVKQISDLPLSEKQALRDLLDQQIANSKGENSAENKRRKQRLWFEANRERYGGLYVALDGDRLLGTGKNYPEAFEAARRAGVNDAFVDFITPIGYVAEIGDWD